MFSSWKHVLKSTSSECRDRTHFILLIAVELYDGWPSIHQGSFKGLSLQVEWSPAKLCLCTTWTRAGCCSAVVIALVPCIVDGWLFSWESSAWKMHGCVEQFFWKCILEKELLLGLGVQARPERHCEFFVDAFNAPLLLILGSVEWEECFLQMDCWD